MNLNINKGFESMIPKEKPKEKKPVFSNQLSIKIFKRRLSLSIELK